MSRREPPSAGGSYAGRSSTYLASTRCQSGGGKEMGQKSGAGVANAKVMAKAPSCDLRAPRILQGTLAPDAALIREMCCPLGSLLVVSSKPPCALTTRVKASMVTSLPSSSCVSNSKRICSKTRSLLRREAESVRGLTVLHHQHCPDRTVNPGIFTKSRRQGARRAHRSARCAVGRTGNSDRKVFDRRRKEPG